MSRRTAANFARIVRLHGGLAALAVDAVLVPNGPHMPLVIVHRGRSHLTAGRVLVATAHTFELDGELFDDPQILWEVDPADERPASRRSGHWRPVHFRRDGTDFFQECRWRDEETGLVVADPGRLRDAEAFGRLWDRIIAEHGYVDRFAASRGHRAGEPGAGTPEDGRHGLRLWGFG